MERGEGISAALDDRTVVQVGHFPTLSPMHHARRNIATQRCIVDTPQGGGAISHCVGLHAHIGVGVSTLSPWTASLYRAPRHSVVFYGSGSREAPDLRLPWTSDPPVPCCTVSRQPRLRRILPADCPILIPFPRRPSHELRVATNGPPKEANSKYTSFVNSC